MQENVQRGKLYYGWYITLTLAITAAPVGAGLIHDHFGSYELVLWLVVILGVSAAGVMAFARPTTTDAVEVDGHAAPVNS